MPRSSSAQALVALIGRATQSLRPALSSLRLQAPPLFRGARLCRRALARRQTGGLNQPQESPLSIPAIRLLGAKALRFNSQHAIFRSALTRQAQQSLLFLRRQRRRGADIKAQPDGGRDLVDVLTAGPGGSKGLVADFRGIDPVPHGGDLSICSRRLGLGRSSPRPSGGD